MNVVYLSNTTERTAMKRDKAKPVMAWAILTQNGKVRQDLWHGEMDIYHTKSAAKIALVYSQDRIARVKIVEAK